MKQILSLKKAYKFLTCNKTDFINLMIDMAGVILIHDPTQTS